MYLKITAARDVHVEQEHEARCSTQFTTVSFRISLGLSHRLIDIVLFQGRVNNPSIF